MTRTRITPIKQPDEDSCGPTALKMALTLLGKRATLKNLRKLCRTNSAGTTTRNMIRAIKKLDLSCMVVEKTTLTHLLSALKTPQGQRRAVIVSYLYALDYNDKPLMDTGHWAVVSSFRPSTSRIILLDSYTGRKTSYVWEDFRRRWIDEKRKRRRISKQKTGYKILRKKEQQLMMIVANDSNDLPSFTLPSATIVN